MNDSLNSSSDLSHFGGQSPHPSDFRRAMGAFPTGVAVVTARDGAGDPVGLTVNSLTSVSLDPVLLLICLDHRAESHPAIVGGGRFAVNLLPRSAEAVSNRFASRDREGRWTGLEWEPGATGSPLLADAVARFDCVVHQTHDAGDHTIVVGRVVSCDTGEGDPLVYHRGRYAALEKTPG
jgi:flavin reductase (DIM6/NTAB) family NADH-FMN oxidoreductase RutF